MTEVNINVIEENLPDRIDLETPIGLMRKLEGLTKAAACGEKNFQIVTDYYTINRESKKTLLFPKYKYEESPVYLRLRCLAAKRSVARGRPIAGRLINSIADRHLLVWITGQAASGKNNNVNQFVQFEVVD